MSWFASVQAWSAPVEAWFGVVEVRVGGEKGRVAQAQVWPRLTLAWPGLPPASPVSSSAWCAGPRSRDQPDYLGLRGLRYAERHPAGGLQRVSQPGQPGEAVRGISAGFPADRVVQFQEHPWRPIRGQRAVSTLKDTGLRALHVDLEVRGRGSQFVHQPVHSDRADPDQIAGGASGVGLQVVAACDDAHREHVTPPGLFRCRGMDRLEAVSNVVELRMQAEHASGARDASTATARAVGPP